MGYFHGARIPVDHCSECQKRMRCESVEMAMPWIQMRCVCECGFRSIPSISAYEGRLSHYLEITQHPRLQEYRVLFAWVLYCLARAIREVANIRKRRKPWDDPLGMWEGEK